MLSLLETGLLDRWVHRIRDDDIDGGLRGQKTESKLDGCWVVVWREGACVRKSVCV